MRKIKPKLGLVDWLILLPLLLVHLLIALLIATNSWIGAFLYILFYIAFVFYKPIVIEMNEDKLVYFSTLKGLNKVSYEDLIRVERATLNGIVITIKNKKKRNFYVIFSPGNENNFNQALSFLKEKNVTFPAPLNL
jgi:hypothetical protein